MTQSAPLRVVEPIPLVVQGKAEIVAFVCAKCRSVASSPLQFIGTEDETIDAARTAARQHCGPWFCSCGTECGRYRTQCDACSARDFRRREDAREAAALAKAKRVPIADYDGEMVYIEDGERFVSTSDVDVDDEEMPDWVWGCWEQPLRIDAEDVIENALERGEHHEDAGDQIERGAREALQQSLDRWRRKHAHRVKTYFPDYGVCVVLRTPHPQHEEKKMGDEKNDAKVLAAAKKLAKAYLKYGKELDSELEALADAAVKRWPELERL